MSNDPIHILLADDDETDRLLFKEAFEELKMKTSVTMVNDGVELMDYLIECKDTLPHLLFLDLNMPLKNGFTCLREIKSLEKLKTISIAIYSTSASEKDMEETFLGGANVYIKKPNDFHKLKKVLEKALLTNYIYQEPPFNKENFLLSI